MKPSTTFAITGIAGVVALGGTLTASAQAATVAAPPACSFGADHPVVEFAHPYDTGNRLDQPLSLTASGTKTCVLTGRATIRLLDAKGRTIAFTYVDGADGISTELGPEKQAVFDLTFGTGTGHHVRPAKVKITLPNGGGTRTIDWNSETPTSKSITVGGFRPWLD